MMEKAKKVCVALALVAISTVSATAGDELLPSSVQHGKLVEFFGPSVARTADTGATEAAVTVRYDHRIDPETFRASIGDRDVTGSFHPVPGSLEVVRIPVASASDLVIHARPRQAETASDAFTTSDTEAFVQPISANRIGLAVSVEKKTIDELPEAAQRVLNERIRRKDGKGKEK